MNEGTTARARRQTTLSRELSEFLVELSIGVHRYAMYPPDHPSLRPVVENIVGRLSEIFASRRSLSIGVAQRQLVIEGLATDQRHPVLSDLARRLHGHQLGALSFHKGVTAGEVAGVLAALARDTGRQGMPIGLMAAEDVPTWEHAHLHAVGYERIHLRAESGAIPEEDDRVAALWLALAKAAVALEPGEGGPAAADVARSIATHRREASYDEVIVGYLTRIAGELRSSSGRESEKVRRRLSTLIDHLDEPTLARLVDFGSDAARRRSFLLDANQTLAVESVVKVLRAAAASSRQSISHSMTRLLTKLASHATQGPGRRRAQADTALRENVEALISGWELHDPNPEAYTNVLDAMSRASPLFEGTGDDASQRITGARRLVEMALELDAWGPVVSGAVADLCETGEARRLLELADEAPRGSAVARRILDHLTTPARFRRLIVTEQLDEASVTRLVAEMGARAVDPLLDVLGDSDSRAVRRRVFDILSGMGPFVGQRAAERLTDGRWFVRRNMLSLLAQLRHVPEDFDPQPYFESPDPRVRREAFPLALRRSAAPERVLAAALADTDERLVRMALLSLREGVSDALLPTLVNRVVTSRTRAPELRALGVRIMGRNRSPLSLATLLEVASAGKSLLGKARLTSATPEALEALRALARHWPDHPEARPVLESAARSRDRQVQDAVRSAASGPPGSDGGEDAVVGGDGEGKEEGGGSA